MKLLPAPLASVWVPESWLFHFPLQFLVNGLGEAAVDGPVSGFLPPLQETWKMLLTTSFSHDIHLGSEATGEDFSLSVTLTFK